MTQQNVNLPEGARELPQPSGLAVKEVGRVAPLESTLDDMNVEAIAVVAYEALRAYSEVVMNDQSFKPWNDAEMWQRDTIREGVRKTLSGEVTSPQQSHDSWLAHKRAEGWQYGPVKDPEAKLHPCFVPYEALPVLQRYKDHLFLAVVRALSAEIG